MKKLSYFLVPYYDRYNWDLIDDARKRDQIIGKWQQLISYREKLVTRKNVFLFNAFYFILFTRARLFTFG